MSKLVKIMDEMIRHASAAGVVVKSGARKSLKASKKLDSLRNNTLS